MVAQEKTFLTTQFTSNLLLNNEYNITIAKPVYHDLCCQFDASVVQESGYSIFY